MDVYHSHIDGVVEVFELTPTREQETTEFVITIPKDALALAIGVGQIGEGKFARAETVAVNVLQNEEPLPREGAIAEMEGSSVRSYMSDSPPPGRWVISVSHKTAAAFVVSVAVFRKPVQALFSFANKHRCKACKVSLRALIYAILAKLTAGGIAALDLKDIIKELLHHAAEILEFLAKTIGVSAEWLKELLGGIGEIAGWETPWGWLARKICEKLGACPAGANDD